MFDVVSDCKWYFRRVVYLSSQPLSLKMCDDVLGLLGATSLFDSDRFLFEFVCMVRLESRSGRSRYEPACAHRERERQRQRDFVCLPI